MSTDFGQGELTDDQLVELARGIAEEIGRRGGFVYEAARDATAQARTAQADAVAAATARADRAWATQWGEWACAKRVSLMMAETLGAGWRFTAWRSPRGERRVYLDPPDDRSHRVRPSDAVRARHGKPPRRPPPPKGKVSFHVDGGGGLPPGYLAIEGAAAAAPRARVEAIVRFIAARWDERGGAPIAPQMMADIVAAPAPPYYA